MPGVPRPESKLPESHIIGNFACHEAVKARNFVFSRYTP
jgi:hypothetical protein